MSTPQIILDSLTDIGNYAAALKARIHPGNEVTTYQFEYDITPLFTTSIFTSSQTLLASNEYQTIEQDIDKLIVETVYYYRLTATNISGTVVSSTKSFKTESALYNSIELDTLRQSKLYVFKPIYRDFNQFAPNRQPSLFDIEVIAQGIHNILSCRRKSRFFKNGFGCNWDNTLFNLNDDDLLEDILGYIIEALGLWEPRAYVDISSTELEQLVDQYTAKLNLGFGVYFNSNKYQIGVNNG